MHSEFLHDITVIVTTCNQKNSLINCLRSVIDCDGIEDLIVVDNGSDDGTSELLSEWGCNYILFDEGIQSWGKCWNSAIEAFGTKKYIMIIDPDYSLTDNSFTDIQQIVDMKDSGVVGFKCVDINMLREHMELSDRLYSDIIGVSGSAAWIMRREVYDKCGMFSERLKYADNVAVDYAIRMKKQGFSSRICEHGTVLSINPFKMDSFFLEDDDHRILAADYKMNYFNRHANYTLCNLIKRDKDECFSVLEIGCDLGATLLEIKNRYPNATVRGMEINPASAEIAALYNDVRVGNIEKLEIPFDETFDYIIFGDVLEHLHNTEQVLHYCRDILSKDGCILASIPNIMNITVMEQLLSGHFTYEDSGLLDRSHVHFFTFYEIRAMFNENGYFIEDVLSTMTKTTQKQDDIINALIKLGNDQTEDHMYKAIQYMLIARKI